MIKRIIKEFYEEKMLREGFDEEGNPDLKYYAFDWDDNICIMPTHIILLTDNDEEIGMSTEDFAEYRGEIGVEPFEYKGKMVVGYAPEPYRNFGTKGDAQFIVDAMIAKPGPSWNDFIECINGGSIFSIITARGHHPDTLKEACYREPAWNHLQGRGPRELALQLGATTKPEDPSWLQGQMDHRACNSLQL